MQSPARLLPPDASAPRRWRDHLAVLAAAMLLPAHSVQAEEYRCTGSPISVQARRQPPSIVVVNADSFKDAHAMALAQLGGRVGCVPMAQYNREQEAGRVAAALPKEVPADVVSRFAAKTSVGLNGTITQTLAEPEPAKCFAICAGNPACTGASWMAPGTDALREPAKCHQLSAVTRLFADRAYTSMVKPDAIASNPRNAVKEAPFAGLSFGEYLNAVYNGDTAEVRRLDDVYLSQERAKIWEMQRSPIFGKLAKLIDVYALSMMSPLARAYLNRYGDGYGACLRADAVSFRIRRTVTEQSRNGVQQSSADTVYQVNREFGDIFEKENASSGPSPINPFREAAAEARMAPIDSGVGQMMGRYRCDDPHVQRFEANLQEIYRSTDKPIVTAR